MSSFRLQKLDILFLFVYICTKMKITQKIENQIKKFPLGTVFKYAQLKINAKEYTTAAKALERLQKKGVIKKVSKGTFYKPIQSVFGELTPDDQEILKPYLFKNGTRIAYITGASLYNYMNLTTQVPSIIKIASFNKRIYVSIGSVKAKPVKSYVEVSDKNYKLLQLLDALKDFKSILDINRQSAITILSNNIKNLQPKDIKSIVKYALKYPPRVQAFLGAILEQLKLFDEFKTLKDNLNPLTTYSYSINKELPTATNWNIT